MSNQIQEEQVIDQEMDDQIVEDQVEETVEETVEEEIEEATDEPEEEESAKTPQKKSDHVPLGKYMEVKNKLKDFERMQLQQQAERERFSIKQEYLQRGYYEQEADKLATEEIRRRLEMEEVRSRLVGSEIKELSQSDSFFADAMSYKAEIREKMRTWNCDAETAYMAVRGKTRNREYLLEQEQRTAAKRRQAQTKKVGTATASPPKSQYNLPEDDKKALAGLQKYQPDAGWTPEKYWKLMKKE